jgi:hypothetical protein
MTKAMRLAAALLGVGAGLAWGPSDCSSGGGSGGSATEFLAPASKEIPLAQARIIFEFNQTDNDLGIQVFLDGESWKSLKIISPTGHVIFEVAGRSALGKIGLTELFFEGEEPSLDEVPLAEMLASFPEGEYEFEGRTVDGEVLEGSAILSHKIPDGPAIVSPSPTTPTDPANTVIDWNPVTTPAGVNVVAYQVIVGSFQITLPASKTAVKVPPELLEPGTTYLYEILAIEEGGNQTITGSSFQTQ